MKTTNMNTAKFSARSVTAALLCALVASGLSGCAVGPDYARPEDAALTSKAFKEAPAGWKEATPRDAELKGDWWTLYGDPALNRLMEEAEAGSENIRLYQARYDAALASSSEADAAFYPSVSASAGARRNHQNRSDSDSVSLQGSVSWELDLWGKLRRASAAAGARAEASAADLENAKLSVRSKLAENYFALRVLDLRIRNYEQTIGIYSQNVRVLRNRYESGMIVKSDLTETEQQLHSAESSRAALESAREKYEHAIAALIGKAPSEFSIDPSGAALPPVPEIPAAVPSSLLERRPDIASAERSMAAANESIGIAVAGYFPSISLTGSGGFTGAAFGGLIGADNLIWSLGASAAQTVFNGGATRAKVKGAEASYQAAVATYRQTVLSALQDTEDRLSEVRSLGTQIAQTEKALAAATESARIKRNQYNEGMIDHTSAMVTEASRLSKEQSLLSLKSDALISSVELIKSLGGGWKGLEK